MWILALFEPDHELTAIFYVIAVALWVLAAFAGTAFAFSRRVGGSIGLVALGLAVYFFPSMWHTFDTVFRD